ncbi:MAG: hypothetical protein QXT31_07435 [Candidatus Bathyarchaeia archaeon]
MLKFKTKERKISWHFLIAFLLGAIFAELTADPISDFLFFFRSSQGPLSPLEQVIYWYFLPASIYFILFLSALLLSKKMKAADFRVILLFFAGVSLVLSWKYLKFDPIVLILLFIPFFLLFFVLFFKGIFIYKRKKIIV